MRYPENTIRFDSKPAPEVLQALKAWSFHWNRHSKCWSAPQSIESATVIDCIRDDDIAGIPERVSLRVMESDCGVI